jgi:hypothetical protein
VTGGEGALVWLVPDGYIPLGGSGGLESHEAICVLNTGAEDARLLITLYFEDREPLRDLRVEVPAERTRHVRTDRPEEIGVEVPRGAPYAARIVSSVPVTVQHSRLDATQPALALMTTMAHPVG